MKSKKLTSITSSTGSASDLLRKLREARASSNIKHISRKKRQRPFIVRCFIPALIFLVIVYVFAFVEVGEFELFQYLYKSPHKEALLKPVFASKSTHGSQNNTVSYIKYEDEQTNDHFVAMWHYIHESDFSKLSPALQTRNLHERFRYKYTDILVQRLRKENIKLPTDYELAVIMSDLYNTWHQSEVNFIQIGACDGNWQQSNDPIQKLILTKPNWHGVMMEPVPYLFDTLTENIKKTIVEYEHRILPINAALSDTDGTQTFYIVNKHFAEELPNESHALKHQIGSFNKDHIIKHIAIKKERGQLAHDLDHYISAIGVKALTPNSVLEVFRNSGKAARDGTIDVVSIDAEGYDYVVLKQFLDNTAIRPLLIMFENLHLSDEHNRLAVETLREHGYIDFKIHWNTLGVRVANI